MHTSIIILAAGNSSRLGQPKQLLPIGNRLLLQKTVDEAIKSDAHEVYVVLGYLANQLREKISPAVHVIENRNWMAGMGSSIKSGMNAAMKTNTDNIIISVADQPLLSHSIFNQLIDSPSEYQLIASKYDDQHFGPPVLFKNSLFAEVVQIDDSTGAKMILKEYGSDLHFINFPEGKLDIDTPEDYQRLRNNEKI